MNITNPIPRISEILQKAVSGAIILPSNPTGDATAAATALYLALHKMGKNVTLACSTKPNYNLTALDKISSQLVNSGDSLVVSFPYQEGAIDKVDYNIQGTNFNLIVSPRPGFAKLNPNQVKYSYTGAKLDFVIIIDTPTLNSLGEIYASYEKEFQGKDIINIDRHLTNSFYGTVNYVNKASSSICELMLKLLQQLGVELDRDIATNLYAGIAASTNNFSSYSVTADTFDSVSQLLRAGAMKKSLKKTDMPTGNSFGSISPTPITSQFGGAFGNEIQNQKPLEGVEKEPTPQDWLKPKIFKGGGGLI